MLLPFGEHRRICKISNNGVQCRTCFVIYVTFLTHHNLSQALKCISSNWNDFNEIVFFTTNCFYPTTWMLTLKCDAFCSHFTVPSVKLLPEYTIIPFLLFSIISSFVEVSIRSSVMHAEFCRKSVEFQQQKLVFILNVPAIFLLYPDQ